MGDRRQVIFEDVNLWFYTHWGGHDLMNKLQNAIKVAKPRWGDRPYLLRIIISQLIGEGWNSETGCGLWNHNIDTEYEDPVVNITKQTVTYDGTSYTFEDFSELSEDKIDTMRE